VAELCATRFSSAGQYDSSDKMAIFIYNADRLEMRACCEPLGSSGSVVFWGSHYLAGVASLSSPRVFIGNVNHQCRSIPAAAVSGSSRIKGRGLDYAALEET
jgi:hypothetical protein